jgi:hypothetical protein
MFVCSMFPHGQLFKVPHVVQREASRFLYGSMEGTKSVCPAFLGTRISSLAAMSFPREALREREPSPCGIARRLDHNLLSNS